jgi:hypothetical protein
VEPLLQEELKRLFLELVNLKRLRFLKLIQELCLPDLELDNATLGRLLFEENFANQSINQVLEHLTNFLFVSLNPQYSLVVSSIS